MELDPQTICMVSRICTLTCNNEGPAISLKVKFKRWHLAKSLRIKNWKKSQNYETSKYCKNIGMQNSTLKKMLINPGRQGFSAFFAWIKALPYAEKKSV